MLDDSVNRTSHVTAENTSPTKSETTIISSGYVAVAYLSAFDVIVGAFRSIAVVTVPKGPLRQLPAGLMGRQGLPAPPCRARTRPAGAVWVSSALHRQLVFRGPRPICSRRVTGRHHEVSGDTRPAGRPQPRTAPHGRQRGGEGSWGQRCTPAVYAAHADASQRRSSACPLYVPLQGVAAVLQHRQLRARESSVSLMLNRAS